MFEKQIVQIKFPTRCFKSVAQVFQLFPGIVTYHQPRRVADDHVEAAPLHRLGEEAGRMLFQLMNGEAVDEREIVLEPVLVVRESRGASGSMVHRDEGAFTSGAG